MKTIAYQETYQNLEGHPLKVPEWDRDGEVVWKTKPDEEGQGGVPTQEVADTYLMVRYILRALAGFRAIYKSDDPQRTAGFYLALDAAVEELGDIKLGTKSYEWFHDMLKRQPPLPVDKDGKPLELVPETFGHVLWQNHCASIQMQLTDPVDRESFKDES